MKKIFFCLICLISFCGYKISYGSEYVDIMNHWAKEDIEDSIENNIVNGYDDKSFRPDNKMTIAEYLKVLVKSGNFKLVKEGIGLWPDYYIATAKANGLILENEFEDYNKKINRNEIARITARYINVNEIKASKNRLKDLSKEYEKEILKLVKLKVINGYEDNTYRGENEVTRAEAITIAKRATEARRKLISERKYDIENSMYLTNINSDANVDGIYADTRYELKNGKIIIYDDGKYSKLQGYEVSGENINLKNVTKVIKAMVDEDSYTGVFYVPIDGLINQLVIMNGENENYVHYGSVNFTITYYEDKPYELRRISMNDEFSENCYMKIEVTKLWKNMSEYNNGNYVDEYKKRKLEEVLEIEFGNQADEILEYMVEKNIQRVSGKSAGEDHKEQKVFGKYVVNYYKKSGDVPKFYIAKK